VSPRCSTGRACRRRTTPRRSRSARTTRAAATSSGSRAIIPAIQSMYEGSNAATCPSVWPWNLPNCSSTASASASAGGTGGRKPRTRPRLSGPVGSEARKGSRGSGSVRSGGQPARNGPFRDPPSVWLRARYVAVVSTRAVTGRVGRGDGGPLREPAAARPLVLPCPAPRAPAVGRAPVVARSPAVARRTFGPLRTDSYAALISAICRVARRAAVGSSPVRSG